jgi:hypothetical protein
VIRYHSLSIERDSLPDALDITATADDGEIMGVRHRELAATHAPLEGVQFHPESILTEHGHALLKNFPGGFPMNTVDLRSDTVTRPTACDAGRDGGRRRRRRRVRRRPERQCAAGAHRGAARQGGGALRARAGRRATWSR